MASNIVNMSGNQKAFTALVDHIVLAPGHYKFTGYTYLWMFLIWGIAFYVSELEAKWMERNGWWFPVRPGVSPFSSLFQIF